MAIMSIRVCGASRISWTSRSLRIPFSRPHLIRALATSAPSSPSSKIRAAPFQLDPAEALQHLRIGALVYSANIWNMLYAALIQFFGIPDRLAETLGLGNDVKLTDMRAALYPVWRCDVILEGKVMNEYSSERVESDGSVMARQAYVPGNPFAPLSYLSFATQELPDDLPEYSPSTDLKQLGDGFEVVPIPFTVSPLGLLKKLRSMVGKSTEWKGLTLEEAKWRETMVACYPIMFPIYIAQFEHRPSDEETRSFTIVLDAHKQERKPRISGAVPAQWIGQTENYYILPSPFMTEAHFFLPMTLNQSPSDGELRLPPGANALIAAYQSWMSPKPTSVTSIKPSPMVEVEAEEGGIDWDDARIQSFAGPSRAENGAYIEQIVEGYNIQGSNIDLRSISTHNESGEEKKITRFQMIPGEKMKRIDASVAELQKDMEKELTKARDELENVKPVWLRDWDAEHGMGKLGAKAMATGRAEKTVGGKKLPRPPGTRKR